MNAPCKDCKDRQLNCHCTCNKYLEFKAQKQIENAARKKDSLIRLETYESIHRKDKRRRK